MHADSATATIMQPVAVGVQPTVTLFIGIFRLATPAVGIMKTTGTGETDTSGDKRNYIDNICFSYDNFTIIESLFFVSNFIPMIDVLDYHSRQAGMTD